MNDLSAQIEAFLLARVEWVDCDEVCARFNVTARQFRQIKKKPGLCSNFAIVKNHKMRHIDNATTAEWLETKGKIVWHAAGELRRIRRLGKRRHNAQKSFKSGRWEKDSGQAVMELER